MSEGQTKEERLRRVFMEQKVPVSVAVTQLFPFLHGLKDRTIISRRMFTKLSQEPKTPSEVVYELLDFLEKKGTNTIRRFLPELFNSQNLQQYPGLSDLQSTFSEFIEVGVIQPGSRELSGNKAQPLQTNISPPQEMAQCSQKKIPSSQQKAQHPHTEKVSPPKENDPHLQKKASLKQKHMANKRMLVPPPPPTSSTQSFPTVHTGEPSEPKIKAGRRKSCTAAGVNFRSPELPVTCGLKEGILHKDKLTIGSGKPCIFADGRWFSPNDFQTFGGRKYSKNWKKSIYCSGFPLDKLLQLKYLKERRTQTTIEAHFGPSTRKQTGALSQEDSIRLLQTPPPSPTHLQDGNAEDHQTPSTSRYQSPSTPRNDYPFTQRQSPEEPSSHVNSKEEERGTMVQPSNLKRRSGSAFELSDDQDRLFSSDKFPVACGSVSGELHKNRFGTGQCGKCIRVKMKWCTPDEFLRMDEEVDFTSWDKDIRASGVPLKLLIMRNYLKDHGNTCVCPNCMGGSWQDNDDECAVCNKGGFLTCCDGCPRSFHTECHLPTPPSSQSSSEQWICTFCKMDQAPAPGPAVNQEFQVLNVLVFPRHLLKCEFLFMMVYCEDESIIFANDPSIKIPNYSHYVSHPMWLNRVKEKLQNAGDKGSVLAREGHCSVDCYFTVERFVRDMRMIFDNCQSFNKDKEIQQLGEKLRKVFEDNLKKVFAIRPTSGSA